ncbi:Phospholipase A2 [Orchesella cincta]|uniref:Phospholipase A2 n=1 Tax=Orchesella cincta TaxID=48709 RepID=A0A1D2MTV0_ORCCI|nr:Phospholipase A2 [Orchesella cincta]
MDESSTFSTHQDTFPDKSLDSLSNLHALKDDDEDDLALQHRISSMGHYGSKYRNGSFVYNYSSHTHPHYRSSTLHNPEYKLQVIGTSLSASHKNPLSLDDDDDDQRKRTNMSSDEFDGNIISQRSIRPRDEENYKENHNETSLRNKNLYNKLVPNETSSIGDFLKAKHSTGSSNRSDLQENKKLRDDEEDHIDYLSKMSFPSSGEENEEDDEYEDDDILLEKFIPGNSTHLSGKHRFRQGSQAEVDGASGDGNSLLSTSRRRPRRSVVHLYDMVVCSTGCNPLIFKGYGCYCGFLGSGLTVDGIDKCCAKHDWCYHHAKCPPLLTYFVPYYWRCDHGQPECVTDFRGWKGVCGAHLCECDRQFAECLKKFPCPRSRAMCITSPWRFWQNLLMTPSMRYRY